MDNEWNEEGREASPQLDCDEHTRGRPAVDGRVRRVVTRSGRGHRGKFPSLKLRRFVHWESPLERDAILATEYDPSVLSYQEQPCVVTYYDANGTVHKYTPDLKIERASGDTFAEVKPSRKLKKPDLRAKLEAIALRMKERNQPFRILTEVEIRREPRYSNLARIHDVLRSLNVLDRSKLEAIPASLKGQQRFGDLVKALGSERLLFRHFHAGNVQIDLDQPISDDSLVVVL